MYRVVKVQSSFQGLLMIMMFGLYVSSFSTAKGIVNRLVDVFGNWICDSECLLSLCFTVLLFVSWEMVKIWW